MKRLLSLLPTLSIVVPATAGDGPGGVGTTGPGGDLRMWLRADEVEITTDNLGFRTVSEWTDLSGNGADPFVDENNFAGVPVSDLGNRRDSIGLRDAQLGKPGFGLSEPVYLFLPFDEPALGEFGEAAFDPIEISRSGEIVGAPLRGIKFYGSAGTEFDGVDDYVLLENVPQVQGLTADFQISVWIKPSRVTGRQRIIGASGGGTGWGLGLQDDNILFTTYGFSDYTFNNIEVKAGVWNHVLVTLNTFSGGGNQLVAQVQTFDNPYSTADTEFPKNNIFLPATTANDYLVGSFNGSTEMFEGAIADLVVATNNFVEGEGGDRFAEMFFTARDRPNNGKPWVTLDAGNRAGYDTAGGWSPNVSSEISLFTVARYAADIQQDTGTGSTLFATPNRGLFVQLPDANGKVSFNFGPSPSDSLETDSGVLRTDFNPLGPSDAWSFRSWGFFSSAANGRRISENGRVLATTSGSSVASFSSLGIGNNTFFNDSSFDADSEIAEVALYNRDLNAAERAIVENHFAAKYQQSPPGTDLFAFDELLPEIFGIPLDYDEGLIGIANVGADQHLSANGSGLTITDESFLSTTGTRSVVAAYREGVLRTSQLPPAVSGAWDRQWVLEPRGGTGEVRIGIDYATAGIVQPPATTHYLLRLDDLGTDDPFEILASGDLQPDGTIDFGPITVGNEAMILAIGHERGLMTPAKTFAVNYSSGANAFTPSRAGDTWTVGYQASNIAGVSAAELAISQALSAINAEPDDGSVYKLDLSGLRLPGSGPATSANTFFINLNSTGWPAIQRNVVIEGPTDTAPGRFVIDGRSARSALRVIAGTVDFREMTFRNCRASNLNAGLGGAIRIDHGDIRITDCIFEDNRAEGQDGPVYSPSGEFSRNGGFGVRGLRSVSDGDDFFGTAIRRDGGDGGFAGGGGAGGDRNQASNPSARGMLGGVGGWGACDGDHGTWLDSEFTETGGGSAGLGGAIFQYRGTLAIRRCVFDGNSAEGGTGGQRFRVRQNGTADQTAKADGFGGAIFLWDEASVREFAETIVQNNDSDLWAEASFNVVPSGGVNDENFYGIGFPSAADLAAVQTILDQYSFINPLTGATNESSPLAYQFRLYEPSGSFVVPDYDAFSSSIAPQADLDQLDANLATLKSEFAGDPDSSFFGGLLLDTLAHRANILGIRADNTYQACLDAPLGSGFVTDLDSDITALEGAIDLYEDAIGGYFDCLMDRKAYDLFVATVPGLPYLTFYYEDSGVFQPIPGSENYGSTRFRDIALLFELLNDYGRSQLALLDFLGQRDDPGDRTAAIDAATTAQRKLQTWGDILIKAFPSEDFFTPAVSRPGLDRTLALWRDHVQQLGTRAAALNGDINPVGFPDDFLMLLPTNVIPGTASNFSNSFHSFEQFVGQLTFQNPANPVIASPSPLEEAVGRYNQARASLAAYEADLDTIEQEADELVQTLRGRFQKITGTTPEAFPETSGSFLPSALVPGSALWEQFQRITAARDEIERNRIQIDALKREIDIEIQRNEDEQGINIKRDELVIEYGDKIGRIDEQIAAIQISQDALSGITEVLDPEALAAGPAGLFKVGLGLFNVAAQAGAEVGKMELESQKEELAVQQMKDETDLDNQLLDINSKAKIATTLLQMGELDLNSKITAQNLRQELARFDSLIEEIDTIRSELVLAEGDIKNRIYADPLQRLEVRDDFQDALYAFNEARQWLFFATRALEYKWNQPFDFLSGGITYNLAHLFRLRSADELNEYFAKLQQYNTALANSVTVGGQPTDWFSLREHSLGIEPTDPAPAASFRAQLVDSGFALLSNGSPATDITQADELVIDFSTAREVPNNFFRTTTYLDKINGVKVLLTFEDGSQSGDVVGTLRYGGVSYLRDPSPGSPVAGEPDRLVGEMTPFSTKTWRFEASTGRWVENSVPAAESITMPVAQEGPLGGALDQAAVTTATVPDPYLIVAFQERAVAATGWRLRIPIEDLGSPQFDVTKLSDIRLRFQHFTATRQAGP